MFSLNILSIHEILSIHHQHPVSNVSIFFLISLGYSLLGYSSITLLLPIHTTSQYVSVPLYRQRILHRFIMNASLANAIFRTMSLPRYTLSSIITRSKYLKDPTCFSLCGVLIKHVTLVLSIFIYNSY